MVSWHGIVKHQVYLTLHKVTSSVGLYHVYVTHLCISNGSCINWKIAILMKQHILSILFGFNMNENKKLIITTTTVPSKTRTISRLSTFCFPVNFITLHVYFPPYSNRARGITITLLSCRNKVPGGNGLFSRVQLYCRGILENSAFHPTDSRCLDL